jgi:hypothetical protein
MADAMFGDNGDLDALPTNGRSDHHTDACYHWNVMAPVEAFRIVVDPDVR